jgi:hypothetical protein
MQDLTAAVRSLLLTDADIKVLVEDRVFCAEVSPEQASAQATEIILIRDMESGADLGGFVEAQHPGIGIFCTGETPETAKILYLAVLKALKYFERRAVEETLIHSFSQQGSPRSGRDPDTQWPYVYSLWTALVSEKQAT